jgi:hypothetical protein
LKNQLFSLETLTLESINFSASNNLNITINKWLYLTNSVLTTPLHTKCNLISVTLIGKLSFIEDFYRIQQTHSKQFFRLDTIVFQELPRYIVKSYENKVLNSTLFVNNFIGISFEPSLGGEQDYLIDFKDIPSFNIIQFNFHPARD